MTQHNANNLKLRKSYLELNQSFLQGEEWWQEKEQVERQLPKKETYLAKYRAISLSSFLWSPCNQRTLFLGVCFERERETIFLALSFLLLKASLFLALTSSSFSFSLICQVELVPDLSLLVLITSPTRHPVQFNTLLSLSLSDQWALSSDLSLSFSRAKAERERERYKSERHEEKEKKTRMSLLEKHNKAPVKLLFLIIEIM